MVIVPNSDVILLKCPLELDEKNQLSFASKSAQYEYFYGLPKIVLTAEDNDYTYVRKDSVIRAGLEYDNIIEYNYVMYRNTAYSNKWFYAFITDMQYVNDRMTNITIKTDVFQTWQFDLEYKKTFVEREHVNDDTIGKHTIPENLELGEFEIVDHKNIPMWEDEIYTWSWCPCFCVSALPPLASGETSIYGAANQIGGVASSLYFFAVKSNEDAVKFIEKAYGDAQTTSDAIVNVFMIPSCCVHGTFIDHKVDGHEASRNPASDVYLYPLYNFYQTDENDTPDGNLSYRLQQPRILAENYQPRNNKLYTSPYSYIYMSNNGGQDVNLKWEDFPIERIGSNSMPTISYRKFYVPSVSVSAKLVFTNYKNYSSPDNDPSRMFNYGISFAKLPVCAWTTDYYTNWLTQNGINVSTQLMGGLASGAIGALTGNPTLGTLGMVNAVNSTLGQMQQAYTTPPQAHGDVASADVNYCFKRNAISCYFMSVRKEIAAVIDSYFDMFGYKVNSLKTPNINGRYNWNYIKTIGCYIEADIPQNDLQEIKGMFDSGLTIWHHANTFMDYSQNNAIV